MRRLSVCGAVNSIDRVCLHYRERADSIFLFQTVANAAKAIPVFRAPEELPQREAANAESGTRRHVCG